MSLREIASDGHTLVLTWHTACDLQSTWTAVTDPGSVAQWLGLVIEGDFSTADYVVIHHGNGYLCRSALRNRDPPRAIEFTWSFPDEPTSTVNITLEAAEDETTLRLVHQGLGPLLPTYRVGWCVHLTYLEAAAMGQPLPPAMFWNLHETLTKL